jgi:hypothetical protein
VDDDGQFISLTKIERKIALGASPYNASCVSEEMSDEHIKLNNNCQ